jgi:hypothetical protein
VSIADGLGKPKDVSGVGFGDGGRGRGVFAAAIAVIVAWLSITKADVQAAPRLQPEPD